jgi:ubiquinol-cytochrome c reductase iron-sulfur subunit
MTIDRGRDDGQRARELNRRAYRAAVVAFVTAALGGLLAAVAYWNGWTDTVLGVGLAAALFGIGFALVSWAKYLDLDEHVVEERPILRLSDDERADLTATTDPATPGMSRRVLFGLLSASSLALIVGFVGPVGSLGPRPRGGRGRTAWRAGSRLVTSDGRPIRAETGVFDQMATVYPEGAIGADDAQVVLIRMRPELLTERTQRGAVDGWVAYSKICTHAGCSVGLFGIDTRPPIEVRELVCPCHQSVFDPVDAARPIGGPATRPLPQLPLAVDDHGVLVAASDFGEVVGPITWDEG